MSTRSPSLALALSSCAAACLCVASCASETRERPVATSAPTRAPLAPLPLPSTAFRGDGAPAASSSSAPVDHAPSRFDTHRIGATEADDGRSHFRGARVDLDLKNAELSEVFRLLSDVGHVNIVVAGEVSGTVTMKLKQVPWDQALEVIARAKGLVLEHDGNVIVVHVAGK